MYKDLTFQMMKIVDEHAEYYCNKNVAIDNEKVANTFVHQLKKRI